MAPMTVEKQIEIAAPAEVVWAVLLDMPAWVADVPLDISVTWEVGGKIHIAGPWHGGAIENRGEVLELVPAEQLAYSFWSNLTGVPDTPADRSTVRFELLPGTLLKVSQDNVRTEAERGHVNFYWTMALGQIARRAESSS